MNIYNNHCKATVLCNAAINIAILTIENCWIFADPVSFIGFCYQATLHCVVGVHHESQISIMHVTVT